MDEVNEVDDVNDDKDNAEPVTFEVVKVESTEPLESAPVVAQEARWGNGPFRI